MNKALKITKYEWLNLRRSKTFYVMLTILAIGYILMFKELFLKSGEYAGGLIYFAKGNWLPINFIMIPLLVISMNIGKSSIEIFDAVNISAWHKFVGKMLCVLFLDIIIFVINLIIFFVVVYISNVSVSYLLYILKGNSIILLVTLITVSSIGYFVGELIGDSIISYVVLIIFFLITCSFYKVDANILEIYNVPFFGSNFYFYKYNRYFLYHKLFWLCLSIMCLSICYERIYKRTYGRTILMQKVYKYGFLALIVMFFVLALQYKPSYYEPLSGIGFKNIDIIRKMHRKTPENHTFYDFSKSYYIDKYDMNLDLKDNFKNNCKMEVVINKDGVRQIKLGLNGNLKIDKVMLDGKKISYKKEEESFSVSLPKQLSKGDKVNLTVLYHGNINTYWQSGQEMFFVTDTASYLAYNFEWYPKLNDNTTKKFNIKVNHKNMLYSNFDVKKLKLNTYEITGEDTEIFILSGQLVKKEYQGVNIIANEEYVNDSSKCDKIINRSKKLGNYKSIILVPIYNFGDENNTLYRQILLDQSEDSDGVIN